MAIRNFVYLSLVTLSLLTSMTSQGAPSCTSLFSQKDTSALVQKDNFAQWAYWEQQSNLPQYRKTQAPLQVSYVDVPRSSLEITYLESAGPELQKIIEKNQETIHYFQHPYNTNPHVPYSDQINPNGSITAYFTASRSLALRLNNEIYTLKLPTDQPHGPQRDYQFNKSSVKEDLLDASNRMSYIERVDREIGLDPELILAKEVAMVTDKKTGEGYLFRDLSFMKDGNYYLPALSIPFAGREIAEFNNEHPDLFWKKHYAEILGRSKAKLLLRYGLQMETPNPQNMLIQLDRNLKPTGVLVFRDLSDTVLIESIARGLGEHTVLEKDRTMGVENAESLRPYWSNSLWRFDRAGSNSFTKDTLIGWGRAHNEAYKRELEKALNIDLSLYNRIDESMDFDYLMSSDIVQQKLKRYRQFLTSEHQKRTSAEPPLANIHHK
ncbi:MAG: hypothetical protein BroJett040_24400 [Oligoflexia bacterium]|nr:MAG: hypothetical protein BroJett040_24400 [Oligoflexia bacterium]